MNETIQMILTRRSIRKFNDKPIDKETMELLMDCAIHAPSGMGKDTWHFVGITNKVLIDELIDIVGKMLNNEDYNMYHPGALIIPFNLMDNSHGVEDNACALENIFIAANSLGIGSVWINQLRQFNEDPNLRQFFAKVGVMDPRMVVYGIAALGYYDEKPLPKQRKGKYQLLEQ